MIFLKIYTPQVSASPKRMSATLSVGVNSYYGGGYLVSSISNKFVANHARCGLAAVAGIFYSRCHYSAYK